jgi:hypothetical protein
MDTFTLAHVVISLIAIGSGLVVLYGMLRAKRMDSGTALFLTTTVLTSITGFFFPYTGFKPSYAIGGISLVLLAIAIVARYMRHLAGGWRAAYVITAVMALYLNCFVFVFQLFLKVTSLHALAPTQSEPPFLVAQIVVMVIFIALGIAAVKKFHPAA